MQTYGRRHVVQTASLKAALGQPDLELRALVLETVDWVDVLELQTERIEKRIGGGRG